VDGGGFIDTFRSALLAVSIVMGDARRHEPDTVDRTRVNTQLTPRAVVPNHDVHLLGGTDDGIHGTCLNTDCATDTPLFIDSGDAQLALDTAIGVQGLLGDPEQNRKCAYRSQTSGRTAIDIRPPVHDRLGVRTTGGVTATRTLHLRQTAVDSRHPCGGLHAIVT